MYLYAVKTHAKSNSLLAFFFFFGQVFKSKCSFIYNYYDKDTIAFNL